MVTSPDETNDLLRRAAAGDQAAWGELLTRHRERLRRMIALRQDRRLKGRLDPSDVLQEACLEASARLAEYLHNPSMPFYLWLRFLTGQKLVTLHRHHLGVQMRDAGQEVALDQGPLPELGKWVRLEVPASVLGLENAIVTGARFAFYGGAAWFERAGKVPRVERPVP